MPKQLNWQKATCPICNEEYVYLPVFKPKTCGKYNCVYEAHKRGLIYKDKVSETNLSAV